MAKHDLKLEDELTTPLIEWLTYRRRVNYKSSIFKEFGWMGHWIDLATLTSTRVSTAYELKLRNNTKAIEQASYNQLSFDRSYIVTASLPNYSTLDYARSTGVGVIYYKKGGFVILLESRKNRAGRAVRQLLLNKFRRN